MNFPSVSQDRWTRGWWVWSLSQHGVSQRLHHPDDLGNPKKKISFSNNTNLYDIAIPTLRTIIMTISITIIITILSLVSRLEHEFYFSIQLGMEESSQLWRSLIFFRGVGILNHQPKFQSPGKVRKDPHGLIGKHQPSRDSRSETIGFDSSMAIPP